MWNVQSMPPSPLTLSHLKRSNSRSLTFRSLISRNRAYLDPKLPLHTNRKPYTCIWGVQWHLYIWPWVALTPRFWILIFRKSAYLGPMLLLNINRKSYMGSPMASSDLTLSDLDRSSQCHPDFRSKSRSPTLQSLVSCKGAKLGHMLPLTINRKLYMPSPMTPWHLTLSNLERSTWSKVKVTWILKPQLIYSQNSCVFTGQLYGPVHDWWHHV